MDYKEVLAYLHYSLPMYHRVGAAAYKADLTNIISICEILGNPHEKFKTIHIAGTNGKGSVSHFLASILQEAGLKTGLFTSPHLKDYRERIKVNGCKIPEEKVSAFVTRYRDVFDSVQPSFFEWTTALAFDYFHEEKVDIAVIETGLGGRLDSTNIITPELSVITNIGWDHTNLLGNSLALIAGEKAGIIKGGIPVVIGQTQTEVQQVFLDKAEKLNSPIYFADNNFDIQNEETIYYEKGAELILNIECTKEKEKDFILQRYRNIHSPLAGHYQVKNIRTVLMASEILLRRGFFIQEHQIISGISKVIENTGIMGRWQVIDQDPLVICDTAHNLDGILEIVHQISCTPHAKLHMVLGFVRDKDIESILKILPADALYYFCKASVPRAMPEKKILEIALQHSLNGKSFPSVSDAFVAAKQQSGSDDMIFIGGSTFVVADFL